MSAFKQLLIFTAIGLSFVGQQSGAVTPEVCVTLGSSNIGSVLGIRIREEDGKLMATMEGVDMWHHSITGYSDKPLKEVEVRRIQLCGDQTFFLGEDFYLETRENAMNHEGIGTVGFIRAKLDNETINHTVIRAPTAGSGYCD